MHPRIIVFFELLPTYRQIVPAYHFQFHQPPLNRIIPSGKIYSNEVLIISSFRHEKRENHVEKTQARYTDGAKDTSELGKKQRSLLFH